MLGKLLKHELVATGRIMLPALGAVIVLAGMANLSYQGIQYVENEFINIMLFFVITVFFLGLFAAGVLSVVIMVQRFYKNMLRDEGYLTFTLPVSVHGLIWSKVLVSLLWIFITVLVCVALFILTVFHFAHLGFQEIFGWLPEMRESLRLFYERTSVTPWDMTAYIAEWIVYALIAGISQCLHFYAAMAIGHSFTKNKVLLSIVFYLIIGFGLQIVSTGFIIATGESGIVTVYSVSELNVGLHRMSLLFIGMQLVQGLILYLLTCFPLKNNLNLA